MREVGKLLNGGNFAVCRIQETSGNAYHEPWEIAINSYTESSSTSLRI